MTKGSERKEIKKSKGMRGVSEKAMNHRDIPGWVSEAAAGWSWINRRPLKQSYLNTGLVRAQHRSSGKLQRTPNLSPLELLVKESLAVIPLS